MRIIAGSLRGRRLEAPPETELRVRPTSDRAREALFSILQRWPAGAFLDLCAGTGAVALEALSRGYGPVTAVEQGEPGLSCLQRNQKGTDLRVVKKDALSLRDGDFERLAVIFADPPYAESGRMWEALAARARQWILGDGVLVWETESTVDLAARPGWRLESVRDYGRVRFHFLLPE